VEEGDAFSLRANPRLLVDELDSGTPATFQRVVEVVDRKADVMDARAALRHESPDGRIGLVRLEKLYQRLAGTEARDVRPVGIVEGDLCQSQHVTE
jgi:hypothetical protein